ncbi:MAG: Zn-ribbon domain-containing OB-fold protein [Candidatus Aenigmarchaeota archaeon]|nr:Zn-ribbon domain-containing OB-fold protein [Candidatus Aenigmarchaeota archaeon]
MTPFTWRRLKNRYNLVGKKCVNCDSVFFAPRMICSQCNPPRETVDFKLSGVGKIVSYSLVNVPPEEHAAMAPYTLAIVQLKEGVKLTSQIVDCNEKDVHIGMTVEAVFRKITEDGNGLISYGFKFRPLLNGGKQNGFNS